MGSKGLHENGEGVGQGEVSEQDDFEKGFEQAENAEAESESKSLNDDPAEDEAGDLDDGPDGAAQSEEMDEDDSSASDQSLAEEDESGIVQDSADTDETSEGDSLAEGRDILDRYFNERVENNDGGDPQEQTSQVAALVTPDEDIADDVADILRVNPDYKEILLEDSDLGKRLRNNLLEFGAETAVPMLESIHQSREISARVDAVTLKHEQDERAAHFDAVGKVHPDYMELVSDPAKKEELGKFNAGIKNWAETLPYKEATKAFKVMESGNASEVSELLTNYKKANSGKDKVDRKKAANLIAVPGKRKGGPPAKPDSNDFDAGFDAAAQE